MKIRPRILNGEMIRAVAALNKTQTRFPYKPVKHPILDCRISAAELATESQAVIEQSCPVGGPSDRVYFRESIGYTTINNRHFFMADMTFVNQDLELYLPPKVIPAVHMPKLAARFVRDITAVRLQRVQDMSRSDAVEEGFLTMSLAEQCLQDIYGVEFWTKNNWVWAITFGTENHEIS